MLRVKLPIDNNLTDNYLIDKVLGGDSRAFGALVSRTEALVAQIVCKMVSHAEDRRDLAQDIYLKTFKNLSTFRRQSKFSTWIATIAYNTCISHLEKRRLPVVEPETAEIIHTETTDALLLKQRAAILTAEIEQLSPVFRTLITLYHKEELGYEEIAQITSLPVGTVKSYLFRARKRLRDNLLVQFKKEEL